MATPEIELEKLKLISIAEKHGLNIQHPEVQAQSQKLDKLIVAQMQRKAG